MTGHRARLGDNRHHGVSGSKYKLTAGEIRWRRMAFEYRSTENSAVQTRDPYGPRRVGSLKDVSLEAAASSATHDTTADVAS